MSLFDTEKRSADALESIDRRLEKVLSPAPASTPPQCARMFSDTLKDFLEAVRSAKYVRQYAIQKAEPYKGSQAYDHMIEDADAKYRAEVSGLQEAAKPAIKSNISLFRSQYQKNTQRAIPSDVMQQLSVFSMLTHPSAAQYERYQQVFRDFPIAQEVLISKYDADLQPTGDGKSGYIPKFGSGAAFSPYRPATDTEVQCALDVLLKNAYSLIDGACSDHLGIAAAAQIRNAERARDPVQMISAVNVDYDSKSERLLSAVDYSFRPSAKDENPEDVAEQQYNFDQEYREMSQEAARVPDRQEVLDYYTKGTSNPDSE